MLDIPDAVTIQYQEGGELAVGTQSVSLQVIKQRRRYKPHQIQKISLPLWQNQLEGNFKLTPSYEHKKEREQNQYQVGRYFK